MISILYKNYIGDNDKALEYYTKEIEQNPNADWVYGNRGNLYFAHVKDTVKAIDDFNMMININPSFTNYKRRASFYNDEINDYDKAIADYNKAIKIYKNLYPDVSFKDSQEEGLGELHEYRAKILFKTKKYEAAISDWISAIQVDSSYSGYANYRIGTIYLEGVRDFDQAIKHFSNSIDLNYWQLKYAYDGRGTAYLNLKKYKLALKDFNKAIELESENATPYLSRLSYYILVGNFEKAINEAEKVIKMDRDDPQGFYYLAYIYNKTQSYYKALNYLAIAIEKHINNEVSEGSYFIGSLNNLDVIELYELYSLRASIYNLLGVKEMACKNYNTAKDLVLEDSDSYNEIQKLISENCNSE